MVTFLAMFAISNISTLIIVNFLFINVKLIILNVNCYLSFLLWVSFDLPIPYELKLCLLTNLLLMKVINVKVMIYGYFVFESYAHNEWQLPHIVAIIVELRMYNVILPKTLDLLFVEYLRRNESDILVQQLEHQSYVPIECEVFAINIPFIFYHYIMPPVVSVIAIKW